METHRSMIAVVDDDLPISQLLNEVLSDEGYTVRCITDIEHVYQHIKSIAPSLVILDVHLQAHHSGWDVLAELRADSTTAVLPVILCTADSQSIARLSAHDTATPMWLIAKPFDLDTLLATVAYALTVSEV